MLTADTRIRLVPARMSGLGLPMLLGILVVTFWVVTAASVPLWGLDAPLDMVGRRLQGPSAAHWLGTDALGRDVLSRTLHGARYSIPIAVAVVGLAVAIGALLGALSAQASSAASSAPR